MDRGGVPARDIDAADVTDVFLISRPKELPLPLPLPSSREDQLVEG